MPKRMARTGSKRGNSAVQLFRQLYFGFYLSVITNLVLLLIKAFWWGPILLGIVLGIATLFWFKVQSTFNRPMTMSSIHAAADFDRADTVRPRPLRPLAAQSAIVLQSTA